MACVYFLLLMFSVVNSGLKAARTKNKYNELPCLTIGGLCVLSTDCPEKNRVPIKDLCPLQQKNGIECCHAIPITETRCQKRGGECVEEQQMCPPNLIFSRATDCGTHEKCCILVS